VHLLGIYKHRSSPIFRPARLTTELGSLYSIRTSDNNFNQLFLSQTVRERDIIELGSLYSNFSAKQQKSIYSPVDPLDKHGYNKIDMLLVIPDDVVLDKFLP
jgi:hypothetical protein